MRFRRFRIKLAIANLTCAALVVAAAAAHSQEFDKTEAVRIVDGLRERQLFELASSHAATVLAGNTLATRDQIDLAVADLQTRSQRALQAAAAERAPFWSDAEGTAKEYLKQFASSPRRILLLVQTALIQQARIEQIRHELEVDVASADSRQRGLELIRDVLKDFEEAEAEISRLMTKSSMAGKPGEALTTSELLTLRCNVQFQAARTLFHRGMFYDKKDRLSRDDALNQVGEKLDAVLQSVAPQQSLWWTVQLDRIAVARSLQQYERVSRIIRSLPQDLASPDANDRLQSELIELYIAQGRLQQVAKLVSVDAQTTRSGQLDLTRVKLLVALAGDPSQNQSQRNAWRDQAIELTKNIQANHGRYWSRRANLLVVGTAAATAGGGNLDMLVMMASEAQRKGNWSQAIEALQRAADKADEIGQASVAFKMRYRVAAIHQQQRRLDLASSTYESISKKYADQQQAPDSHLMACWCLAKNIGNDPELLDRYQQMLEHHVDRWPQGSTADQARIWLANVYGNQLGWPAAIGQLLAVSSNSSLFPAAVKQLRSNFESYLAQAKRRGEAPSDNLIRTTVERLGPLIALEGVSRDVLETSCEIAVLNGQLALLHDMDLVEAVTANLPQVARMAADNKFDCANRANALMFIRRCSAKPAADWNLLLSKIQPVESDLNLILEGLMAVESRGDSAAATGLIAAYQYFKEPLAASGGKLYRQWVVEYSRALEATGESNQAIDALQQIARQFPRDLQLQMRLAQSLTRHTGTGKSEAEKSLLDNALGQWRRVARGSKPNSEPWFRAKYHVALLLDRQGKTEEAIKLLNYMRAIPPGWSTSPISQQFDTLYARIK